VGCLVDLRAFTPELRDHRQTVFGAAARGLRAATVEEVRDVLAVITSDVSEAAGRQYVLRIKSLLGYAHHKGGGRLTERAVLDTVKRAARAAGRICVVDANRRTPATIGRRYQKPTAASAVHADLPRDLVPALRRLMRRRYCSRASSYHCFGWVSFAACLRTIYVGRLAFASCAWGCTTFINP
jgi:hypothetical protein